MSYHDLRTMSFDLTPLETEELRKQRYNGESTIRLGLEISGFESFVVLNPELMAIISSIYRKDKKLSLLSAQIPANALNQFVTKAMIDEIQQSNEVENVDSTRKEIKDAVAAVKTGKRPVRFTSMVRKYMYIQSETDIPLLSCDDIRSLYDEFILDEVIREDSKDAPDGDVFRKEPVHIANRRGDNVHDGLFPESKIILAMESALGILNNENIDILIRVALFHYFFGYIHPFYNGNGRMARFISSYKLSQDFSKAACLRTSYVIKEHRKKYYTMFKDANDKRSRGELTNFVKSYLLFFLEAIDDTYEILSEKYALYQTYERLLNERLDSRAIKRTLPQQLCFTYMLQADLFGESTADIESIAYMMECSTKTARRILTDMGDLITYSKDGHKQIWHINLRELAKQDA